MSSSFFERSKKYLARLERPAWKESRVGTSGQHWDRLATSGSSTRTGFPRSLIKIPRSISPPRLIPANPRKTTSQVLPTRKAPAGLSVLTIINETVPNLGGLASVPIPTLRYHTDRWQPHHECSCVFRN